MLSPPVPFWLEKSPPCTMNFLMTKRTKRLLRQWKGFSTAVTLRMMKRCWKCAFIKRTSVHQQHVYLLRWKGHPLKCRGFPVLLPIPFSPVHRARKFSAVLGTMSAKSSNTIRPARNDKTQRLVKWLQRQIGIIYKSWNALNDLPRSSWSCGHVFGKEILCCWKESPVSVMYASTRANLLHNIKGQFKTLTWIKPQHRQFA